MSENFLKKLFETKTEGEEKQTETPKKNNESDDESDDEKIENYKEMNLDRPEE